MARTRKFVALLMSIAMLAGCFTGLNVAAEENAGREFPGLVTITPLSKPDSPVGVRACDENEKHADTFTSKTLGALVGFDAEEETTKWTIQEAENGTYFIINQNSGMVMCPAGGNTNNGKKIIQWEKGTGIDHQWVLSEVVYKGESYYTIVNAKDRAQSLAVNGDTGNYCIMWTLSENSTSQLWKIEDAASTETEVPTEIPTQAPSETTEPADTGMPLGYAAYYSFDGNYNNAVTDAPIKSDKTGMIDASKISGTAPGDCIDASLEASYSSARAKSGKSLNLTEEETPKGLALDYMMPAQSSYTVSYWAKATRVQDKNGRYQKKNPTVLFDASDYAGKNMNYLYSSVYSTYNEFIIRDGQEEQYGYIFGKEKAGYNNWQMYTYTYDASTKHMYLYINGQLVTGDNADKDVNPLVRDANLYIGVNPWSATDGAFAGYIDELYIYEKVLSADDIEAAYNVLKDKGEGTNNVKSVVLDTTNDSNSYRCGVVYGRGIELQYQQNPENNGKLITTSEYYSGGRMDAEEYFPIFESVDGGQNWNEISGVYDTENNSKKFYADVNGEYTLEGEENGVGASTYYNTKWSMRHQPHLYELPVDWEGANLKAGTVLCAGLAASLDTTATETATDFDGNLHTRIDLYYSEDACQTWKFLGHAADGGESRVDWGGAIWEPNLIYDEDKGKLYCFYSDERGYYEKEPHVPVPEDDDTAQILVAQGSADGKNWNARFDVVNYHEENNKFRPGMPVVTRMATGEYVVAYEGMGMGDPITYTYYKISNGKDIESWNATETDRNVPGCNRGSPYCCTLPTGEVVFGSYGSENVFVNRDNLATNTFTQHVTEVVTGYSRSLFPMRDGRLFVVSGGRSYPAYKQKLEAGVIDIGLCADEGEGLRVGTEIPNREKVAQRAKGVKIFYPSITNGKVQFTLNQYLDKPYDTVKVRATNKATGVVCEMDVTMRETAKGTRFDGARLNAQTVVTDLAAEDMTKCVIDLYDADGKFLVTTNETGEPEPTAPPTTGPTPPTTGPVIPTAPPTVQPTQKPSKPEITNARLTGSTADFTLNHAKDYDAVTAYAVEYDENHTLAAVKMKDVTVTGDKQDISIPYTKTNANHTTKILVWKDMTPITESVVANDVNTPAVPADYTAYYSFDGNYNSTAGAEHTTTAGVGVMAVGKYGGNNIYGGESPRNAASPDNDGQISYSSVTRNGKGQSLELNGTHGVALDSYIPDNTSFTVSYWTKYTAEPRNNLNGNPAVLLDGSDYSQTVSDFHALNYIQTISGAYTKTGFYVKGINPRTDKNMDISAQGRYQINSDEWVLNTFTFDAGTNRIRTYQNGKSTDRPYSGYAYADIQDRPGDWYITVGADQWGRGYTGLIDDLYVYERILSEQEIASLYDNSTPEGYDEAAGKRLIEQTVIPYEGLAGTGTVYRCGVNYARAIQLQKEGAGEYKGRCYLTSEFYPDGRWDHHEYFPVWESKDYGLTWEYVGKVEDTEHNKKQYVKDGNGKFTVKATAEQLNNPAVEKNTYYGYEWRMRLQPVLYELPEDFGGLKAGTLLCAGVSTTTATKASSDTDYDGDLQTSIDIFYSVDGGRNWSYMAHAMDGGLSYSGSGEPIWEPYLIMDQGYLYCFYSDERGMRGEGQKVNGQKLIAVKLGSDLKIDDIFDVVNMSGVEAVGGKWARPGMPVVAELKEGGFVMVYENVKYGETLAAYMKFADHIDDWKTDYESKGTFIEEAGGGSPYVCVMPDGKVVINAAGQSGVFVFDDKSDAMAGKYTMLQTGFEHSYSRSIFPVIDENGYAKLLMARGGGYDYTLDTVTGPSKLTTGVFDLNAVYNRVTNKTEDATGTDPLVYISFDEGNTGTGSFKASKGGTVKENGTVHYTKVENGTKALHIEANSGANYLELPEGVLDGAEAATVSMWVKSDSRGWPFLTTPLTEDGAQSNNTAKYLGFLATDSTFTAQKYDGGARNGGSFDAAGDFTGWTHVVIVYEADATKMYVNGSLAAVDSTSKDIKSVMTAGAKTWIGHANWGKGEGFSGMIDEFRLYDRALTEEEIQRISPEQVKTNEIATTPTEIEKSKGGNPILRTDGDGNMVYTGDPAAVVIGDTVYLVAGHDVRGGNSAYNMPEWLYYTSKDMENWTYGGVLMEENWNTIPWASRNNQAWAGQMTPYTDTEGNTKYYFYFCTSRQVGTRYIHSIGVACANSPEGPYTSTNEPLVNWDVTDEGGNGAAQDIDPTIWVDTDENGEEYRYLIWGNTECFVAELNDDMVSVKDMNGDGKITYGVDIKHLTFSNTEPNQNFTEGPWLYRRQDENGNYYGKYYMFAAWGWSEKMGYATADNPWGPWTFEEIIMENTLTSGTNHPSVIDFNGKTYFIYHNGALPGGTGGSRSVCVQELEFNKDGSVKMLEESSIGLGGTASIIQTADGKYLGHDHLENPQDSGEGVYTLDIKAYDEYQGTDTDWEIIEAREVPKGENAANYVSIQSVNKEGLFIKYTESLFANQKDTLLASDNIGTMGAKMSYKTVKALDGSDRVSFESAAYPGKYLCYRNGKLETVAPTADLYTLCSFAVSKKPDR